MLKSDGLHQAVLDLKPGCFEIPLDDDYLDEIAAAFGQVVDAKSPYTPRVRIRKDIAYG